MSEKRKHLGDDQKQLSIVKKSKTSTSQAVTKTIKRTSTLHSPIIQLTGHEKEVYTVKFSPNGQFIASAGLDKHILLWNVNGDNENFGVLNGQKGSITEIIWSRDSNQIYSASSDKTIAIWDINTGEKLRRFRGHTNHVNSLTRLKRGGDLIASASDDCTIKIWDQRVKNAVSSIKASKYQITAVEFSEDGSLLFGGGIDNSINAFDTRKLSALYSLDGHTDTITGLRLSPDGTQLLSNSMDNSLRVWDVKPFAIGGNRQLKAFQGAPHGFEKNLIKPCWSANGDFIATGSGDRTVVVWNAASRKIVYKLPGHKGCVNEVDFHPDVSNPILASCSNDKTVFLGEINPDEVY